MQICFKILTHLLLDNTQLSKHSRESLLQSQTLFLAFIKYYSNYIYFSIYIHQDFLYQ
jgi:hypothetical protein